MFVGFRSIYAISSDIKWQMLHILTYIPRFSVGILVYANTNPSPHSIYKTAEIDGYDVQ
jgi:hypothetical protein